MVLNFTGSKRFHAVHLLLVVKESSYLDKDLLPAVTSMKVTGYKQNKLYNKVELFSGSKRKLCAPYKTKVAAR